MIAPAIRIEFADAIPPLAVEERTLLEASILREGCRDPLVTWDGILLDGHNRKAICDEHGVDFSTVEVDLPDRAAAEDWIDANQLGRRNLTPDVARMLRGRRYNRTKQEHGKRGPGKKSGQDVQSSAAETLAAEHGVNERTIRRDAALVTEMNEKQPGAVDAIIKGEATVADVKREIRREEVVADLESVAIQETKATEGTYDVLVIDPPWPMHKIARDCRPNQVGLDYPTMTLDEIRALEIPTAETAHVWLWTTQKHLPSAFGMLEAWGLKYVCAFVWRKPGGPQPFALPQYNCEFALYARTGAPEFIDTKALPTCFEGPRGKHSEKPEVFYDTVRRVTAGRRLDMFSRRPIPGFDAWGNQA